MINTKSVHVYRQSDGTVVAWFASDIHQGGRCYLHIPDEINRNIDHVADYVKRTLRYRTVVVEGR
jgi:hypothetical protein